MPFSRRLEGVWNTVRSGDQGAEALVEGTRRWSVHACIRSQSDAVRGVRTRRCGLDCSWRARASEDKGRAVASTPEIKAETDTAPLVEVQPEGGLGHTASIQTSPP